MAAQSVIISNPNSFSRNVYVNNYLADYNSSESSDSSALNCSETTPVQMQNISSTSYSGILNESFSTIDPVQRMELQFHDEPYLTIIKQPKCQLRFRYKSEKGKHGGLKPIVKLNNCHEKDVFIKASLYTNEETPTLHVFDLEAKSSQDGIILQKLSKDNTAEFPSLSVYTKKKDEILLILQNRLKIKYKEQRKKINEQAIKKEAQEEMKKLSLNAGRLCFEAFHDNKRICRQIFSDPFYDQKCTTAGDLKIVRLGKCSGKAFGGDEIILLCEKIRKDDIEVRFFEQDEAGEVIWEANGEFNPTDVHHQVAIPFKTPQFRRNIEKQVFICLHRKSDQKSGEPVKFYYIKDEQWNDDFSARSSKRKKPDLVESTSEEPITHFELPSFDLLSSTELASILDGVLFDEISDDTMPENVNMEAVSLALSKTNIQNPNNVKKGSSTNSSMLSNQIKDLKIGIANILKTRDVDTFLKFLPNLMKVRDEKNNTLLHLVILEKSENLLLFIRLLEFASKDLINEENSLHLTPLHLAVSEGLWKHARVLLRFGADPNLKNQDGNNAIHLATKYNFPRCLSEVLVPIFCDRIRNIMPDINVVNYEGLSPLHIAVWNESEKCTELLVKSKANINATDGISGKTPLHIAYDLKNSRLIEYLTSQPDINRRATDFRGFAPCSVITYAKAESRNTKPTECCIEMSESTESNHSVEENNCKSTSVISGKEDTFQTIDEVEEKLVEILNKKKLWKKLGIYLMDEKELEIIEDLESAPAKAILKTFKKKHNENYLKELKNVLSNDASLVEHVYELIPKLHL